MSPLRKKVCAFINAMDVLEQCTAADPEQQGM